jgi:hypothetical protein
VVRSSLLALGLPAYGIGHLGHQTSLFHAKEERRMLPTLEQKEEIAKKTVGKKVRVHFPPALAGQPTYFEATCKEYTVHPAGIILVYFEEIEGAVVNLDLLRVFDGTDYKDIYEPEVVQNESTENVPVHP